MSLNKSSFTKPIQYGILSQCWQNKIVYFNMEKVIWAAKPGKKWLLPLADERGVKKGRNKFGLIFVPA